MALSFFYHSSPSVIQKEFLRRLEESSKDPFTPPVILAPNPQIGKWLKLQIAKSRGACLNLRPQTLETGVIRLCQQTFDYQKNLPLHRAEDFIIAQESVFLSLMENQDSPFLKSYLQEFQTNLHLSRIWNLSQEFSLLFRELEYHSPAEEISGETDLHQWILGLYHQSRENLIKKGFSTLRNFALALKDIPPVNRPWPPVFIWGFPTLSPLHYELLKKLGESRSIEFYSLQFQLESTPFELWTAPQKLNQNRLEKLGIFPLTLKDEENALSKSSSHLAQIQNYLRNPETGKPVFGIEETSVTVKGCQGIFREAESFYLDLVKTFQDHPHWNYGDVAVMISDPGTYQVPLRSVLEHDRNPIPHQWVKGDSWEESLWAQGCRAFLEVLKGNATRPEILDFLTHPCFLASQDLENSDFSSWATLSQELGAFYEENGNFSFQQAKNRLLAGKIMSPPEFDFQSAALPEDFQEIYPYAPVLGQKPAEEFALALGTLFQALNRLREIVQKGWNPFLEALEETLTQVLALPKNLPLYQQKQEQDIAEQFSRFVHSLRPLDFKDFHPSFAVDILQKGLQDLKSPHRKFLTSGGVALGSPEDLHGIPFKAIYWLGLNEDHFPGNPEFSSLDPLSGKEKTLLDFTAKLENYQSRQFLFLQSLLMAQEKITFFYQNFDPVEQAPLYPSPVLRELFLWMNPDFVFLTPGEKPEFSVCYSQPSPLKLEDDPGADILPWIRTEPQKPDQILDLNLMGSIQTDKERTISLRELNRFLEDPFTALLEKHAGFTRDQEDPEIQEFEPFETAFQTQESRSILEALITQRSSDLLETTKGYHAFLQKQGQKPRGNFGTYDAWKLKQEVQSRVETFQGCKLNSGDWKILNLEQEDMPLRFQREKETLSFTGEFSWIKEENSILHLLSFVYGGKSKLKHLLNPFITALILKACPSAYQKHTIMIHLWAKNEISSFDFILDISSSAALLQSFLNDFFSWESWQHYLPLGLISEDNIRTRGKKPPLNLAELFYDPDQPAWQISDFTERKRREKEFFEKFREEILDSLGRPGNLSYGYSPSPLLKLIQEPENRIPENALTLFIRRHQALSEMWITKTIQKAEKKSSKNRKKS